MAPSAMGATQGRSTRKRITPRPRNGFSRTMARMLETMMTTICEPMVKTKEFLTAIRKLRLCRMLRKFSRPTKCNSVFPIRASLKA